MYNKTLRGLIERAVAVGICPDTESSFYPESKRTRFYCSDKYVHASVKLNWHVVFSR